MPSGARTGPGEALHVACLCAEWCGVCRDYRPQFERLAAEFGGADFEWIDIEDDAGRADAYEVEDFPTILVQRGDDVLFYGTMPPQVSHLRRLLESLGVRH
jgi:thiol-disulfide isomerase/thioredoxin